MVNLGLFSIIDNSTSIVLYIHCCIKFLPCVELCHGIFIESKAIVFHIPRKSLNLNRDFS